MEETIAEETAVEETVVEETAVQGVVVEKRLLNASSALATAGLAMLVLLVVAALLAVVMSALGLSDMGSQMAVALPVQGIAVGAFVWMRARRSADGARGALALRAPAPTWTWALVVTVLLAGLVSDSVLQGLTELLPQLGGSGMEGLNHALEQSGWRLAMVLLGAVIVAPVYEEILFRGVVYKGLERSGGVALAITVSSLLFAAFHVDPIHGLAVLPIGLLLGYLRWRSSSIWPCILAHALNNLVWAVMGLAGWGMEVSWVLGLVLALGLAAGAYWIRPRS